MADSGTRTYKAAKRYIYAWGGGKAEGNGGMKDLLGGKGAGLRGDDQRGSADSPRIHHHHRSLQRLLRRRQEAPGRTVGRRPGRRQGRRGRDRQGLWRSEEPAPGIGPFRRQVLACRA